MDIPLPCDFSQVISVREVHFLCLLTSRLFLWVALIRWHFLSLGVTLSLAIVWSLGFTRTLNYYRWEARNNEDMLLLRGSPTRQPTSHPATLQDWNWLTRLIPQRSAMPTGTKEPPNHSIKLWKVKVCLLDVSLFSLYWFCWGYMGRAFFKYRYISNSEIICLSLSVGLTFSYHKGMLMNGTDRPNKPPQSRWGREESPAISDTLPGYCK